ncbi:unnamed protein product, partial [marine sediment metagenome]
MNGEYQLINPVKESRYSLKPSTIGKNYLSWPKLVDLSVISIQGMDEDRANALINIEHDYLSKTMKSYFDPAITFDQFCSLQTGLSRVSAGFEPKKVREKAQKNDKFNQSNIQRYLFRPYDRRWCYYTSVPNVWKRSRPELGKQLSENNSWLLSRASGVTQPEGVPFSYTENLFARDSMRGHAVAIPIYINNSTLNKKDKPKEQAHLIEPKEIKPAANLSPFAQSYLESLEINNSDVDVHKTGLIWMHALAIGYSPAYLKENADGIRKDWPRIPLPDNNEI